MHRFDQRVVIGRGGEEILGALAHGVDRHADPWAVAQKDHRQGETALAQATLNPQPGLAGGVQSHQHAARPIIVEMQQQAVGVPIRPAGQAGAAHQPVQAVAGPRVLVDQMDDALHGNAGHRAAGRGRHDSAPSLASVISGIAQPRVSWKMAGDRDGGKEAGSHSLWSPA